MKNFENRENNSPDGRFVKNDVVSKKIKADVLLYDTFAIDRKSIPNRLARNKNHFRRNSRRERYLNNQKSRRKMSPLYRKKILVQKIPRLNQNVFSEKSNVMVKLEMPDEIRVDDHLSPADSLVLTDASVKQENCRPVLDSSDNDTFHDTEFIEPLHEDFQGRDDNNFTAKAALKSEVYESACCHEDEIIGREFKNALKNEELFVGEEFKHEESISSYENVESIAEENNEEIRKMNTRFSRKRKKCLDCDDCSHGLEKKSRIPSHNKVVTSKTPVQGPKTCKSLTPSKPNKPESSFRVEERKTKDESLYINSPGYPETRKREYRLHCCDHCNYKGRRRHLTNHFRKKHPYLFPNDSVCFKCDMKFNSWEEMQRHQPICLRFLICKFCLVNVPSTRAMMWHMKAVHPKKICRKKGERMIHNVCLNSMTDVMKTLKSTSFGQRYMEIRKFYLEIRSELIKLHCLKCEATHEKITINRSTRCGSCASPLLFQCQKCKDTRSYYIDIWKHLMSKSSSCSIFNNSSLLDHEESSDVMDRASSNETNRHDCGICDFKGTTTTQLYEHILNIHLDNGIIRNGTNRCKTCSKCGASFCIGDVRFKKHEELCGITVRFPCRFCPMTCYRTDHLSDHIAIMHFDELDGKDVNEFLQETLDFKRMVRGVNSERYNKKLRNEAAETEKDYYHNGIESMLKPVCIECKTDGTQESERCAKCQASLSFVCLKCDELFSKYSVAWDHATRICENRSFTLTVGKTCRSRAKLNSSTSKKKLLSCDLCHFKNARKSTLRSHIERIHAQSREIQGRFTCPKCYLHFVKSSYFQQHILWCRTGFDYTCPFCDKTSPKLNVIEYHITMYHAHDVRRQDTYDILQQVFENKKAHPTKPRKRFDKFGRIIKRTFAENIKLAKFHCTNCDDTVHKDFRYVSHTRMCPKCNGELRVHCKICNRVFSKWELIANHFQVTECGDKTINRELSIKTHELDHSYSLSRRLR